MNDHDLLRDAVGKAILFSVYDTGANVGFVVVGTSCETPAFAVEATVLWWKECGMKMYPGAQELLVLADCGGGDSVRSRVWKYALQHQLCNPYGLRAAVRHYPPGPSKWNPADHRLHSEIRKSWASKPLDGSDETLLAYIRTTETDTGLRVKARLLQKDYVNGQKISNAQMDQLRLTRHKSAPDWNHALAPN